MTNIEKAEEFKTKANELFKKNKYNEAIKYYSQAIDLNGEVPSYFTNRAFCYIKTEAYGAAIEDSDKAIQLDSKFVKAYYRRATANLALYHVKESLRDFRAVNKLNPSDATAKAKLLEVEKLYKRILFEQAIQTDHDKRSVADSLDLSTIEIEPSYDGELIDSEVGITEGFVEDLVDRFKNQKKIHRKIAYQIVLACKELFAKMDSLVDVDIPEGSKITVCGDVHGQYYDLLNIFELNGKPSPKNMYLFNGDFVDRGSFSVEVIFTLLAYKWLYPNSFFLNRGNHETNDMNKVYGFEGEVKAKFNEMLFNLFSETFDALPLAHLIQNKFLVLHGGLFSKDDVTLNDIRSINRFCQPSPGSLMSELLWSDPQPELGRSKNKRGVGVQFGPDITKSFCDYNNIDMIIRSHEVKDEGYTIDHDGKCVTVFSAPNYCDSVGNKGAYIHITPDLNIQYYKFDAVAHPDVKPMQYSRQFSMGM